VTVVHDSLLEKVAGIRNERSSVPIVRVGPAIGIRAGDRRNWEQHVRRPRFQQVRCARWGRFLPVIVSFKEFDSPAYPSLQFPSRSGSVRRGMKSRRQQDLPWGTISVAPARHRCPKIPDFHRAFVCVKGAVGSLMCDPEK